MSALWTSDGSGWHVLEPTGFPSESVLHDLIESAPELLPLSGAPRLTILGREVGLTSGIADLVAVEVTGQPVFIEIKLERNPEARRAVVAQVLSYAASVHGIDLASFETQVLGLHLARRGYSSIADAVASRDDAGLFEAEIFRDTLTDCLATGTARLVLVVDAAPAELMKLAGYLEAVSARLAIDLVTVRQFEVGGRAVIVPQRVDPGREQEDRISRASRPAISSSPQYVPGADDFVSSMQSVLDQGEPTTTAVVEWVQALEHDGLARFTSTRGISSRALRVQLLDEDAGPVTLFRGQTRVSVAVWGSVLNRRSPVAAPRIEQALAPQTLKEGGATYPREITEELLDSLTAAYREAAGAAS